MHPALAASPPLRLAALLAESIFVGGRSLAEASLGLAARLGAGVAGQPLFRERVLGPLHSRSRALRGARISLLRRSRARDPRDGASQRAFRRDFWWLEVRVEPRRVRGNRLWRPKDLALVAPEAYPRRPEADEMLGHVHGTALFRDGKWHYDRYHRELLGPERVLLLVSLRPGTRQFRFRYYLELLQRRDLRSAP